MADDLSIKVGNNQLSGWTDIRVTRGVERCPSDFDISLTELFPGQASAFVAQAGDPCQVMIGNDLILTGYVDRYLPSYTASQHSIRISGRSKCADLVDCSAEWPGSQISGPSALNIAKKLATPYGIAVNGLTGTAPPQFNFMLGETAFDIIERVCRNAGLLAYDQPDGSLLLANVSTTRAASGFAEGKNVLAAAPAFAEDQTYSEYDVFLQSMNVLGDVGGGGNLLASIKDPNTRRHRKLFIIAEAGGGGLDVAIKRGNWECARRRGRARAVSLTADSWRDANNILWTPNTLAPVDLPRLKVVNQLWAIGEVTYKRNETGTTAELVLMPPSAYLPEPILLQPLFPDVVAPVSGAKL